jgi:hypothetical protein
LFEKISGHSAMVLIAGPRHKSVDRLYNEDWFPDKDKTQGEINE